MKCFYCVRELCYFPTKFFSTYVCEEMQGTMGSMGIVLREDMQLDDVF